MKMQFVMNISHVICHQKLTRLVVGDKIKAAMSSVFLCFVLCVLFFLADCCIIVQLKFEKEFRIRKDIASSRRSESGERHEVKIGRDPSLLFHAFFIILLRTPYLEKAAKDEGMKVRSFSLRIQPSKGLRMVLVQICI